MRAALLTTVAAIATTTTVIIAQQQVIVNNPDINDNNLQQRRLLLSRNNNQSSTQKATHKGYEKEQLSRRLNKERRTSTAASAADAAAGSVGSNNENAKTGVKRTSRHAGTNGEGISRGVGGRHRRGGRDKESVIAGESNVEEEVKGTPKGGENKESSVETSLAAAEEIIEDEKIILESLSQQVEQSSTTQQEEEESTNNNEKLQQHSINKLPNIAGGLYNNAGISVTDRIKKIYTGIDGDSGSKGENEIPYDNTNSKSKSWNSPKTEMPSTPEPTYSPSPSSSSDKPTTLEPTWKGDDWKTPKPTTWNNNDDWTKGSSWNTKGSTMKSKHSSHSKSKKTTPTKKSTSTSWNSWDDNTPPPTPWGGSSWDDDDMYPSWDDDMWSKSNKSHKKHKTNKSSTKERTISVCTKRLLTAFTQMEEFNGPNMPFEGINKPSDVTKHCSFMPPMNEEHVNYGCPFIYDPNNPMADKPTGYGFVEGEKEYQMYWKKKYGEGEAVEKFATAYNNFAQYCQCYQGYDMGCASRIPHGPPTQETKYMNDRLATANGYSEYLKADGTTSDRAEFCKIVGVWNGDFNTDVVQDFTDDVKDCGCYWIGVGKDMVGTCPGVELGAWYKFPPLPGPTPSPSPPPTPQPTPDETIAEIVKEDPDLTTLYAALDAADLVDDLSSEGPFTLFAPTDEAFDKLPDGTVESLLQPENKDTLTAILTYHVVAGQALSSDLSNGQDIPTVNGKDVHVTISDDGVMINQAKVIDPDILARNGVIHKIDDVLLPPEITLIDSFEPGETEFPNGPWEIDYYYDEVFETTDTQAFVGDWSVVTPDICNASSTNDDFSYMTLTIDPDLGPGKLTYYVNSKDLNYPADVLVLVANDEDTFTQGWTGNSTNDGPDEWNKYTLDLQNGRSTGPQGIMSASTEVNSLTWYYICKPFEYEGDKPGGRAYIDYITFTPKDESMEMIDLSPPKYWTFPDP